MGCSAIPMFIIRWGNLRMYLPQIKETDVAPIPHYFWHLHPLPGKFAAPCPSAGLGYMIYFSKWNVNRYKSSRGWESVVCLSTYFFRFHSAIPSELITIIVQEKELLDPYFSLMLYALQKQIPGVLCLRYAYFLGFQLVSL